jgi:hypothetical protein
MPRYVYQTPGGKQIERYFEFGKAPKKIGRYERIISFPKSVTFKGGVDAGWTRCVPEHKVSWGTVFKHINYTKQKAKENEEKQLKHLKTFIADHL